MNYPVIMAGGIGKRFWPLSTPDCPKQFLNLVDPKKSMIQATIDRMASVAPKSHTWIVSHQNFRSLLKKHAKGTKPNQWLLEPMMRNTAPCIAWAAERLLRKDRNAVMIVSPADHWITGGITGRRQFSADIKRAVQFVKMHPEALVTFGAKPDRPETGYGYIEIRDGSRHLRCQAPSLAHVKRFTEKPSLSRARAYLRSGRYLWNTGIFVWRADTLLKEIQRHLPDVYDGIKKIRKYNVKKIYSGLQSISIDYGILEKSKNVHVLKASFGWTDLGSWKSIFEFRKGGVKNWVNLDSKDIHLNGNPRGNNRPIATVGVSDLIVVDHPNGLLICHRDESQRVGEILQHITPKS